MRQSNARGGPTRSPATRRNGTLQSCEPCRKAKLRCDHARPVCGRCSAKNRDGLCYYHPAPMTKQGTSSRESPPTAIQRPQSRSTPISSNSASELGNFHVVLEPGYLGSTSYSAILAEHRGDDVPSEIDSGISAATSGRSVDPDRLRSGLGILKLLNNVPICDTLIRKFYKQAIIAVLPNMVMESIMCSIREVFGGFNPNDAESQFQEFAYQIFQNSSRKLKTQRSMTFEQYCSLFTGRNFRWEALGNIFAVAGIALMYTPENDPTLMQAAADLPARDKLTSQIIEASRVCIGFCDQAASTNELLGFLQYNDVMLRTQRYGDASYEAWRCLGDLSATIYAAGLHHENSAADDCPDYLCEWRRACFASAFFVDKAIATFVGRPPLINYRYCTLTPPLDLSEKVLTAGGDVLNESISQLDVDGWNRKGKRHRVSIQRLRFLLAIFREECLEIALGTRPQRGLVQKANHILGRAQDTWETVPDHLRYDRYVSLDHNEPYAVSFALLHSYLDYLYSCFLLQRTLVKRANTGQASLFDTSRQLLSAVIQISAEKDASLDLGRDYSWIVLYYGLPSASVLLLEILRQTQESGPFSIPLPRAEIIRNLSVFVSCLSWVARPHYGNYHVCRAAEKKVSHILDQILDPKPAPSEPFDEAMLQLDDFLNWYGQINWDFNLDILPLEG